VNYYSQQQPLIIYTAEFCACDPLHRRRNIDHEYVVHGDSEYIDETVYVNTCESHRRVSNAWLSCIGASQKIASHGTFERSNSDKKSTATPDEKRSSMLSERRSEINNVLHKSVLSELHGKYHGDDAVFLTDDAP
jgi:hypothetical protein